MMTQLKNKITESSFHNDINKTLRQIAKYTWIFSGILFLGYGYFVGAITFSVVEQQALEQSNKGLVSTMSKQELHYLANQKDLGLEASVALGLTPAVSTSYALNQRAFAWNVGR